MKNVAPNGFVAANKHESQFVKSRNGSPVWYAGARSEAHVFATREEAQEWCEGQFRGKGHVVEVASQKDCDANSRCDANSWDWFNDEPQVDTDRHLNSKG